MLATFDKKVALLEGNAHRVASAKKKSVSALRALRCPAYDGINAALTWLEVLSH